MNTFREFIWHSVKRVRQRLPLFFSEEARIAKRHRAALIDVITSPPDLLEADDGLSSLEPYLRKFAREFETSRSRYALAQALVSTQSVERVMLGLVLLQNEEDAATRAAVQVLLKELPVHLQEAKHEQEETDRLKKVVDQPVANIPAGGHGIIVAPHDFAPNDMDWDVLSVLDRITLILPVTRQGPNLVQEIDSFSAVPVDLVFTQVGGSEDALLPSENVKEFADWLAHAVLTNLAKTAWPRTTLTPSLQPVLRQYLAHELVALLQDMMITLDGLDVCIADRSEDVPYVVLAADPAMLPLLLDDVEEKKVGLWRKKDDKSVEGPRKMSQSDGLEAEIGSDFRDVMSNVERLMHSAPLVFMAQSKTNRSRRVGVATWEDMTADCEVRQDLLRRISSIVDICLLPVHASQSEGTLRAIMRNRDVAPSEAAIRVMDSAFSQSLSQGSGKATPHLRSLSGKSIIAAHSVLKILRADHARRVHGLLSLTALHQTALDYFLDMDVSAFLIPANTALELEVLASAARSLDRPVFKFTSEKITEIVSSVGSM